MCFANSAACLTTFYTRALLLSSARSNAIVVDLVRSHVVHSPIPSVRVGPIKQHSPAWRLTTRVRKHYMDWVLFRTTKIYRYVKTHRANLYARLMSATAGPPPVRCMYCTRRLRPTGGFTRTTLDSASSRLHTSETGYVVETTTST